MPIKPASKRKAATKKAAKTTDIPVKSADLKAVIPELEKIVQFQKTSGDKSDTVIVYQPSFKDAIHDTIVTHEMLNTKRRIEKELENCGDVFYITEEEAKKIEDHHADTIKKLAIDALIIGAGCFILGIFYGRRQIINEIITSK